MANTLKITGLSGIDTQEWLDQIMAAKRKPLDSLFQKQQLLLWKQEAYQEQYTSLSKLRESAFNLKLQSNYATKKVNSSKSEVATATATNKAGNASYYLEVEQLATAAVNSSTKPISIRSSLTGKKITSDITINATNNSFEIKLDDGSYQTITLAAKTYSGSTGLKELAADIQKGLEAAFAADPAYSGKPLPVYVKVTDDNQLMFYAGQKSDGSAHTIVLRGNGTDTTLSQLGFSDYDSTKAITGSIRTSPVTVDANNNKFKISIGGVTKEVELDVSDPPQTYDSDNFQDLADAIEAKLHAFGGDFAKVKVSVNDYNQFVFNYVDGGNGTPKSITLQSGSSSDILYELGITSGTVSEYPKQNISPSGTLLSQKDKFASSKFFDDLGDKTTFGFTINGQSFTFSLTPNAYSNGATLNSIMAEINGNSAAGVSVYYDEFTDKLVMTSTKTGNNNESGNEIQINDPSGFFTNLLNIDPAEETGGENAKVIINGVATEQKNNSFTMNGVTFNLTDTGKTTLTVSTDVSNVADKVEEFINSYNELIATINKKLSEERAKSGKYEYYLPLTDEQRKVLSEDQIKIWESKAKQGILRRDSLLTGVINEMRTAFTKVINTPRTLSGTPLAKTINLGGANRITVTLGQRTKEIVLNEGSYSLEEVKTDLQQKLNIAFGQGQIKVEIKNNALSFTTQNTALTLNSGNGNDGLAALGFSNGATVSASFDRLSQIGITTGVYTENGKLNFDKDAFQEALEKDPDAVIRLLTNFEDQNITSADSSAVKASKKQKEEASKGVIYKLHEILTDSLKKLVDKAGNIGTIGGINNTIGKEYTDISERISALEDRLEQEETRLSRQFAAMERALAEMNSQASYFSSFFGGQ